MSYIIVCLFFYAGILIFDIIPLIKKKSGKELLIYIPIYLFTLTINILYGLGFDIPSPADPIKNFISSILGVK